MSNTASSTAYTLWKNDYVPLIDHLLSLVENAIAYNHISFLLVYPLFFIPVSTFERGLKFLLSPPNKQLAAKEGGYEAHGERIMLEYYRFRDIYELFLKGKAEEAKQNLQELQARYLALCDENISLRSQVQGYEDILYLSRNLVFDGSFYWLMTGSIKQGPFCPSCYNREGFLLRLTDDGKARQCLTCGAQFDRSGAQALRVAMGSSFPGVTKNDAEKNGMNVRPRKATIIPFGK